MKLTPTPNPSRPGGAEWGLRYPGRRLEDSPVPWAIISSSFQDFSLRCARLDKPEVREGKLTTFYPEASPSVTMG
ncbi:MAG TPA: hypothetical protein VK633_15945 [Verrucomicrobiae bacterium]|nr:hypothetical protein [Verrucomicrobiae bacterium]